MRARRHGRRVWQAMVGVVLALLLLVGGWQPGAAQGEGSVNGTVRMGTADAELPPGLEVELLFLPNGQGPPQTFTTPVEADGSFSFEALDPSPNHRYLVRVQDEGHTYFSQGGPNASPEGPFVLAFKQGESELVAPVEVFAQTDDLTALKVAQAHFVVIEQGGAWQVGAIYSLANESDRLIVPADGFKVPLPEGATRVAAQSQNFFDRPDPTGGVVIEGNEAAVPRAFPPGASELTLTYLLPYTPPAQTLALPVGIASDVVVLVADRGQTIQAPDLTDGGTNSLQGESFRLFSGQGVDANAALTLEMSGLPPASAPPAPPSEPGSDGLQLPRSEGEGLPIASNERPEPGLTALPVWTPIVFSVLAVAGLAFYLWRRPEPTALEARVSLHQRRDRLIAELADLDERHAQGTIGQTAYRRQREAAKAELRAVLRRLVAQGEGLPGVAELQRGS